MGISVPGLLNFRGDRWQVAADLLRSSARGSTAQADSLRAAADAMSKAWSDEIGAMIAERCRQQADLVEQQATTLPPLADALDAGAAQMQDLSTEMLKLVERAAAADVVVTDDGERGPPSTSACWTRARRPSGSPSPTLCAPWPPRSCNVPTSSTAGLPPCLPWPSV